EGVQRNPDVGNAVVFGRRQMSCAYIDLQGRVQKFRGGQGGVAFGAKLHEFGFASAAADVDVVRLFLRDGRNVPMLPPAGSVVVTHVQARLVGQREQLLY